MATIKQIFWAGLALSVAEKAIQNAKAGGTDIEEDVGDRSLTWALNSSFVWDNTPEGGLYWAKLYTELTKNEGPKLNRDE